MSQVNIHQAKTNLSRLIAEVEAGGDVVISRGNTPVAKLVAITPQGLQNRVPNRLAHFGKVPDNVWGALPDEELEMWENGAKFSEPDPLG